MNYPFTELIFLRIVDMETNNIFKASTMYLLREEYYFKIIAIDGSTICIFQKVLKLLSPTSNSLFEKVDENLMYYG